MRKSVLFSLILFSLCARVPAAVRITETAAEITAATPGYRTVISKTPYRVSVRDSSRTILEHAGTRVQIEGGARKLDSVTQWRASGDTLFLTVAAANGPEVAVSLEFGIDRFAVSYRVPSRVKTERIEETFSLSSGGHWFGGNVTSGHHWPLETGEIVLDPFLASSNQTTPIWLTSSGAGVFMPAYEPMGFSINREKDGLFTLSVANTPALEYTILATRNIAEAHRAFLRLAGKPEIVPPREYFEDPIFNTWIEYMTKVTQADMEDYARKIRKSGFPCTILMLDDGWLSKYGDNRFEPKKFPHPRRMVEEIHKLGFKLVLWNVPFVEQGSMNFDRLAAEGWLVKSADGKTPGMTKWWNGEAAMVDLSNPAAYRWFLGELQGLQREYGVDGYKLDAGDAEFLRPEFVTFGGITPNRYTDLWAGLGRHFEINELRVSWLAQPWGLVERLRDKSSTWSLEDGLASIVPHGLTESIIGYPYFCPDIIGGGLDSSFLEQGHKLDEELFIRWTQASAFMPMMQFSYAPWRLSAKSGAVVKKYALLHRELGDYIWKLALQAREDGTPMVKPLFFRNPEDERTYAIRDQFLLGDRFLVAPVLTKGTAARDVYLPAGLWKDFWSAKLYRGGQTLKAFPAPIDTLPVFVSVE